MNSVSPILVIGWTTAILIWAILACMAVAFVYGKVTDWRYARQRRERSLNARVRAGDYWDDEDGTTLYITRIEDDRVHYRVLPYDYESDMSCRDWRLHIEYGWRWLKY